jgi:hypothetical protein
MATAYKEFELLQEMLHLSVYVLDCFLSLAGRKVMPKNLQLVGITSLLIASKYEEMLMLSIDNLSGIFSVADIRGMEVKILCGLYYKTITIVI